MMKREHHQISAPECCGICGCVQDEESRCFLHHLLHRGGYRRLCTNCVLKSSAGSFCPICLQVYDEGGSPSPHARLMCLKCPSIAHSSCVAVAAPQRFTCPPCSNPNFIFFKFKCHKDTDTNHDHTHDDAKRFIDQDSAKALLAAAKLAAISMNKAAFMARFEAERRVREAILAKKRAREALERLLYLAAKDKEIKDNSNSKQLLTVKGSATATVKPSSKSKIGANNINNKNGKPAKGSNGLCSVSPVSNNARKVQDSRSN